MEWCILIAALVTLGIQSRRQPLQNVVTIAFLLLTISFAVEWFSSKTGLPIVRGLSHDIPAANHIAGISRIVPFVWLILLLNFRWIIKWVWKKRRAQRFYGTEILLITSGLVALCYGLLPLTFGRPMVLRNLPGAFLTSIILLLAVTPWLIEKKPQSFSE